MTRMPSLPRTSSNAEVNLQSRSRSRKLTPHWLDTEGDDLASLAVVVPSWTLIVTFVVGLVVGAVAGRLMAVQGSSGAPDKILEPLQPETKPVGLASGTSGVSDASDKRDAPASGVDDLVSELERRYQGRRADGEADKPAQGRDL